LKKLYFNDTVFSRYFSNLLDLRRPCGIVYVAHDRAVIRAVASHGAMPPWKRISPWRNRAISF